MLDICLFSNRVIIFNRLPRCPGVTTIITNSFDALVMTYTSAKIMRKIFRSLSKTWEAKVMAIQEAKDLTKLPLKELIGSLIIYKALSGLTLLPRVIGFERASPSPL